MYVFPFLIVFGFKDDTSFIRKNISANVFYPAKHAVLQYCVWLGPKHSISLPFSCCACSQTVDSENSVADRAHARGGMWMG